LSAVTWSWMSWTKTTDSSETSVHLGFFVLKSVYSTDNFINIFANNLNLPFSYRILHSVTKVVPKCRVFKDGLWKGNPDIMFSDTFVRTWLTKNCVENNIQWQLMTCIQSDMVKCYLCCTPSHMTNNCQMEYSSVSNVHGMTICTNHQGQRHHELPCKIHINYC
jgi:hypothetical protein